MLPLRRFSWQPVAAVALPLAVGAAGGIVTAAAIPTWYRSLEKPAWNPPDGVFGPVWTALYLGMGVALALVLSAVSDRRRRDAVILFGLQLSLNLAWTLAFFGLRDIGLGFLIILALSISIGATIWAFARVNGLAAGLLVPYLAWVTFATVLNGVVWLLNAG